MEYNSVSETQGTCCPCEASGPTCWPLIPAAHGNSSRSTTASVWCECISWSSISWRSSLSEWSKLRSPNSSMMALWMNCTTAWKLPICSEGRVVPFGWSFLCRMSRRKWQIRITDSLPGGSVEAQQPPVLKDTHDCWIGAMMPTRVGYINKSLNMRNYYEAKSSPLRPIWRWSGYESQNGTGPCLISCKNKNSRNESKSEFGLVNKEDLEALTPGAYM